MAREKELQERSPEKNVSDVFRKFRSDLDSMFRVGWPLMRTYENVMPVNMKDEGDRFTVEAGLPGVRKEDVDVNLENNYLTIKAQTKREEKREETGYLIKEWGNYTTKRMIKIPEDVKEEEVKARMDDGILRLDLPKKHPTEKKGSRTIDIE